MVLEKDGTKIAIVSVDLVGVSGEVKAAVVGAVRARGFTSETLMVAATHNHSGPGGLTTMPLFRPMMGLYDEDLAKETTRRIADAVARADDALAPARVAVEIGETPGIQRNRASDNGPVDESMTVLRVNAPDGKLRGLLVHFAAHPTILGAENLQISAEWPGACCDEIERIHPGATAMVLQGAEGDVSPAGVKGKDFEQVASYGTLIAHIAIGLISSLADAPNPELRGLSARTAIPPTVGARLLGRAKANELAPPEDANVEFQFLSIAGLRLYTIPGEPTTAIGQAFRALRPVDEGPRPPRGAARPYPPNISQPRVDVLVACANDHLGYFTDRAEFRRGGYESSLNLVGPTAERWICSFSRCGSSAESWRTGSLRSCAGRGSKNCRSTIFCLRTAG